MKNPSRIVVLSIVALALALGGLTVLAAGGHLGGFAGHGSQGGHMAMARLLASLDLNEEQKAMVGSLHETMSKHHGQCDEGRRAHQEHLVAWIESGNLDIADAHRMVDGHIEQMREFAYQVSADLVVLINSLDDEQRATVVEHIEALEELHQILSGGNQHGKRIH